jgi:hypothetical protein
VEESVRKKRKKRSSAADNRDWWPDQVHFLMAQRTASTARGKGAL